MKTFCICLVALFVLSFTSFILDFIIEGVILDRGPGILAKVLVCSVVASGACLMAAILFWAFGSR